MIFLWNLGHDCFQLCPARSAHNSQIIERSWTKLLQTSLNKSDQAWLERIRECRASGLTDKAWCELHQISRSTFYNHLRKLRKCACEIPETAPGRISLRQEVVPVEIRNDDSIITPAIGSEPEVSTYMEETTARVAVCIKYKNIQVEILNGADDEVIQTTLSAVGRLC